MVRGQNLEVNITTILFVYNEGTLDITEDTVLALYCCHCERPVRRGRASFNTSAFGWTKRFRSHVDSKYIVVRICSDHTLKMCIKDLDCAIYILIKWPCRKFRLHVCEQSRTSRCCEIS